MDDMNCIQHPFQRLDEQETFKAFREYGSSCSIEFLGVTSWSSQNGHIFWRKRAPAGPARARWWQRSNKSRQPSGACASHDLVASRGMSTVQEHEFTSIESHGGRIFVEFHMAVCQNQ